MRAGDGDARRDKEVDKEVDEDVDEDVVAALALEFGGGDGAGGDLNAHEWSRDEWRLDPGMFDVLETCLLYTSPSPRDRQKSRMPSSA